MDFENKFSPEDKYSKFDHFFGSDERKTVFLDQVLSREDIQNPDFIFHLTNSRSLEIREKDGEDDKYFSFSKEAFSSLAMLNHRFLQKVEHPGFTVVDKEAMKPIFIITDYNKLKSDNDGYSEKKSKESNELEVKTDYRKLINFSLLVGSAGDLKGLIDYLRKDISGDEHSKQLQMLEDYFAKWTEIEDFVAGAND